MNILKVEELRSIIISLFLFIFIIGCNETVLKSELVVINCIFYLDDQLYSGKYKLQKGDRSKVLFNISSIEQYWLYLYHLAFGRLAS